MNYVIDSFRFAQGEARSRADHEFLPVRALLQDFFHAKGEVGCVADAAVV